MAVMLRARLSAVVIGGTMEAIGGDGPRPRRPTSFYLSQPDALGRLLPREFVPADLIAQEAVQQAASEQQQATAGPAAVPAAAAHSVLAVAAGVGAADPVQAAASGAWTQVAWEEGPLDCLEACCLQDDLHLFSPAGPTRSLLTWARLPLPLLYEGTQFCYPLRQYSLPAPVRQLALNRCAATGWDSCLWHANLPTLAARSDYTLTLLQLAPPQQDDEEQREGQERRRRQRQPADSVSVDEGLGEEGSEGDEEGWEDDGGGFELQQLAVVGTRRPTAYCCWHRQLTQQPLLLLCDATLLEVQLQQGVQVVEAWQPPAGTVPQRLQGVLQVQSAAQPRTVVLSLRDRLARLDMRGSSPDFQQLWQCPQGQHLTAICAPPAAFSAVNETVDGSPPPMEHLLAAAVSTGVPGSGSQVLIFDLRRPYQPVATWQQPGMDKQLHEAASILRWMPAMPAEPTAAAVAAATVAGPSSSSSRGGQQERAQWGGLVVAASIDSGRVMGCQYTAQISGPTLLARDGGITEKPGGCSAMAAMLDRLQAALQQQEDERQRQWQQQQQQEEMDVDAAASEEEEEEGSQEEQEQEQESKGGERPQRQPQQRAGASAASDAALTAAAQLVPAPLQRPPPLPIGLQFLWQPAQSLAVKPLLGPPQLLLAPVGQQPALAEQLAVGRLLLQKQQAAAGGTIQISKIPLPGQQPRVRLLGAAAVARDWATQEALPLSLLGSLTQHGDVVLSLLQQAPLVPAQQQAAAVTAQQQQEVQQEPEVVPVLLPAARAATGSGGSEEEGHGDGVGPRAAAAAAAGLADTEAAVLPYVRGVPKPLVAAVAAREIGRCGCCRTCLGAGRGCLTVRVLERAGLLAAMPRGQRLAEERPLLTVPAGKHRRSIVQLPLHVALAQLLLLEQGREQEGVRQPAEPVQQQQQQQQKQQRQDALLAVLRQLRRTISLQELHVAVQLQQQVDGFESASSSSGSSSDASDPEGEEEKDGSSGSDGEEAWRQAEAASEVWGRGRRRSCAAAAVTAAEAEAATARVVADAKAAVAVRKLEKEQLRVRRQLLRQWLRRRRHEQQQQQQQRREALVALLEGSSTATATAAAASRAVPGSAKASKQQRQKERRRQCKRKSAAAASGQRLEPGSAALEAALQMAGLLPQRRPRGSAAEVAAAYFAAQQQGQQLREPAAALLPPLAAFQQQVAAAVQDLGDLQQQQQEQQWEEEEEEEWGPVEWHLRPRSYAVHGRADAGLPARVEAAGAAATALLPMKQQQQQAALEGPSNSAAAAAALPAGAPSVLLRWLPPAAGVSVEAAAALQELRAAWDSSAAHVT